jgi:phytanoyl-CoA hydroxylase
MPFVVTSIRPINNNYVKKSVNLSNNLPSYLAPEDGCLSHEMLADFHDAGVLILRDFSVLEECQALRKRALELVADFDPDTVRSVFSTTTQLQLDDAYFIESGDKIRFFLEEDAFDESGQLRQSKEDSLNKMGHAMHDLDPVFDRFSRSPKLAKVAEGLGFENPAIVQSMYIFKPPRIGGEVVCHQDSTYIYTEPESCIGFWFALEDATVENGCMYFIPGGHKMNLKQRNYRVSENPRSRAVAGTSPVACGSVCRDSRHISRACPAYERTESFREIPACLYPACYRPGLSLAGEQLVATKPRSAVARVRLNYRAGIRLAIQGHHQEKTRRRRVIAGRDRLFRCRPGQWQHPGGAGLRAGNGGIPEFHDCRGGELPDARHGCLGVGPFMGR